MQKNDFIRVWDIVKRVPLFSFRYLSSRITCVHFYEPVLLRLILQLENIS
jgi:hypothetical protein